MRGEHREVKPREATKEGIIPACAGSTGALPPLMTAAEGSSPHARGALSAATARQDEGGDHPRMRGEH